jgi:gluconolactonase
MILTKPISIDAVLFSKMPDSLRLSGCSLWSQANVGKSVIDCFLEGPSFDRYGVLHVVDIPHGRVLTITPQGRWDQLVAYDGWPNGLKIHRDGSLYIADYRRGLVRFGLGSNQPEFLLSGRNSESFRGCNDLFFTKEGSLYFTDQGQTGMHDPTGRVYRLDASGKLTLLVSNVPSPNGIVANLAQNQIYVAATRGNAIWRLPIMADGQASKVGLFIQLSGGIAGPDGLALDEDGGLLVCQVGIGVLRFDNMGVLTHVVRSPTGVLWANLAFGGEDQKSLFLVDSTGGAIHTVHMPFAGVSMFSHADIE